MAGTKRKYGKSMGTSSKRRRGPVRKLAIKRGVGLGSVSRSTIINIGIANGSICGFGFGFSSLGVSVSQFVTQGGSGNPVNVNFPGNGDMSAMYNAYRIKGVKMKFMYNNNYSSVGSSALTLPTISIANDFDDVNILQLSDILQRDGAFVGLLSGDTVNWKLVPKVSLRATSTGTVSQFGAIEAKGSQWISTGPGFVDVIHYGTKFVVDSSLQTTGYTAGAFQGFLQIFVEVDFELKHSQ